MTLGAEMLRTNSKVLGQVTLVAESEAGSYSAKHRPVSLEYLFVQQSLSLSYNNMWTLLSS